VKNSDLERGAGNGSIRNIKFTGPPFDWAPKRATGPYNKGGGIGGGGGARGKRKREGETLSRRETFGTSEPPNEEGAYYVQDTEA